MRGYFGSFGAALALASASAFAQINLIRNGDFEQGPTQSCGWICISTGSTQLPHWSVVLNTVDRQRTAPPTCPAEGWLAYDGEHSIDLNGCSIGGKIEQSVPTLLGRRYRLRFQHTVNAGIDRGSLRVHIDGQTTDFTVERQAVPIQPWEARSIEFIATSLSTRVGFESLNREYPTQWAGPVIDSVILEEVPFDLAVNGSFEAGPDQSCGWICLQSGSTVLPGWLVVLNSVDRQRTAPPDCPPEGWLAFHGEHSLDLNGCSVGGAIEQTIETVPGEEYRVAFQLTVNAGNPRGDVRVSAAGTSRDFSVLRVKKPIQPWFARSMRFVANSTLTTLRFESLNREHPNQWAGPVIDAVEVRFAPPCAGDVVRNGVVDGADIAAMLGVWGTDGGIYPLADVNGDGIVDGADLAALLSSWGPCL